MKLYRAAIAVGVGIAVVIAAYAAGYRSAQNESEKRLTTLKAEWQNRYLQISEESRKKEKELSDNLAQVITERDNAKKEAAKRAGDLSALADRVRQSANNSASRDKADTSSNDSGKLEGGAVGECQKLLGEGADLLAEGSKLLEQNAIDHDSLLKAVELK